MKGGVPLWLKVGVIGIALLGTLLVALVNLSNKRAEQAFAKELAEAKSLGLGTGMDHFIRQVDPAQNAALAMQKQLASAPKIDWRAYEEGTLTLQEILDELALHNDDAQIVAQAARLPEWYPERNWQDGAISVLFPEFAGIKSWVYYFTRRAHAKAIAKDFKEAEEDFLTASRLATHVSSEDTLMGAFVHIASNSIIRDQLLKTVQATDGDPAMVAIARKTLAQRIPADFHKAIAGEAAFQIEICQNWNFYEQEAERHEMISRPNMPNTPVNPNRLGFYTIGYINQAVKLGARQKPSKKKSSPSKASRYPNSPNGVEKQPP